MDDALKYGEENFNLPHDVIKLPSRGIFWGKNQNFIL